MATITSMATKSSAGQSHPLSRLESLPIEVLLQVAKDAGDPWLPYSSPFLYGLLESDETYRNEQRKETLDKAFKTFGSPSRKGRASNTPTALDYAQVFGDIVQLPWFVKKVFNCFNKRRATHWISAGALRRWTNSVHGAWALFNQPKWTQALGDFVGVVLTHWPEVASRTDPAKFACHEGVLAALNQGSAIGIQFLTGMKLKQADIEPEEVYDNDPDMPQTRWIKRWKTGKTLNKQVVNLAQIHESYYDIKPVIAAMYLTRIKKEPHRYARRIRAYLAWFYQPANMGAISCDPWHDTQSFLELCAILRNRNQSEQLDSEDAEHTLVGIGAQCWMAPWTALEAGLKLPARPVWYMDLRVERNMTRSWFMQATTKCIENQFISGIWSDLLSDWKLMVEPVPVYVWQYKRLMEQWDQIRLVPTILLDPALCSEIRKWLVEDRMVDIQTKEATGDVFDIWWMVSRNEDESEMVQTRLEGEEDRREKDWRERMSARFDQKELAAARKALE